MKPKKTKKTTPLPEGGSEALADALAAIERNYGKGAIMRLGQEIEVTRDGISTGSLALDVAIGARGLPRGRCVEVFGPESSGKTTPNIARPLFLQVLHGFFTVSGNEPDDIRGIDEQRQDIDNEKRADPQAEGAVCRNRAHPRKQKD